MEKITYGKFHNLYSPYNKVSIFKLEVEICRAYSMHKEANVQV